MGTLGLNHCLLLSALLFGIGAIGVLTRRNIIMVLMCLELMFNAANINLVAVARFRPDLTGQVFTVFTIAVAAAEMAFAGGLGMDLYTMTVPRPPEVQRDDVILFSESNSRFLCEVAPERTAEFEAMLGGVPCAPLGRVIREPRLRIRGLVGQTVISERIEELKETWQKPLRW